MPPNAIEPGRLAQTSTRFFTGLVILLCCSNGYGTDTSGGAGETTGSSGESALEELDFMRLLDREYLLDSGIILNYWILPMLDIYTILGSSDGEMDSTVNTFPSTQPLGFNFTGTSYAAVATLVMG